MKARVAEMRKTFLGRTFPILDVERSRFLLLLSGFFIIAFLYSFLRQFKDRVTNSVLELHSGNYLKLFTFFASLVIVAFIQNFLSVYDINTVFEKCLMIFAGFMVLVAIILFVRLHEYPILAGYRIEKPDLWAQKMFVSDTLNTRGIGPFVWGLVLLYNQWVLAFFYVIAEVAGSIMVSFMFLTYLNSNCSEDQNSRFVRVLYLASNVSAALASVVYLRWNKYADSLPFEQVINWYVYFTLGCAGMFVVVYVIKKRLDQIFRVQLVASSGVKKTKKSKLKVSATDGVYYAIISRLLRYMCVGTLAYNVSSNLSEGVLKFSGKAYAKVKTRDQQTFNSQVKSYGMLTTSVLTIFALLAPTSALYETFGILIPSMVPLCTYCFTAVYQTVLAAINYPALGEQNMSIFSFLNESPRHFEAEVYGNLVLDSLGKVSKYAFFDIVKELVAMKINPEIRPLFKGVNDGVCGKFGKCVGALYSLAMNSLCDGRDPRYYQPYTGGVILLLSSVWAYSIFYLASSFSKAKETGTYMSPDYIEGFKVKTDSE